MSPGIAEHVIVLLFAIPVVIVALAVYLLPTFIAIYRRHTRRTAIIIINALLGWTVAGWLAAMIWSLV